jgi:arylsulfatase
MLPPFHPEGFEALLTYWNHYQNRYKYRDKGYDEMLLRTIRAMYYACISFIDHQVGRILARLEEDIDNTLVIYTSDHGELLGDYGSFGKRSMLNAAARVPLLVRYPARFAPGARCDTPTTLLDLWPTCLAAAGDAEPAVSSEGQDLADIAAGVSRRDTVYSQFSEKAKGVYMAATRDLKYVYSAPDNREWLFDLARDPLESHDFAGNPRYAARQRALKQKLITRFQEDDYLEPLDGDTWRVFEPSRIPESPDALLLLQGPSNLDGRLAELGDYIDQ